MARAWDSFRKESEAHEQNLHDRNWAHQHFAVSCVSPCGWNRILWGRKTISWVFPGRFCGSDPTKSLMLLSFEGSGTWICCFSPWSWVVEWKALGSGRRQNRAELSCSVCTAWESCWSVILGSAEYKTDLGKSVPAPSQVNVSKCHCSVTVLAETLREKCDFSLPLMISPDLLRRGLDVPCSSVIQC